MTLLSPGPISSKAYYHLAREQHLETLIPDDDINSDPANLQEETSTNQNQPIFSMEYEGKQRIRLCEINPLLGSFDIRDTINQVITMLRVLSTLDPKEDGSLVDLNMAGGTISSDLRVCKRSQHGRRFHP